MGVRSIIANVARALRKPRARRGATSQEVADRLGKSQAQREAARGSAPPSISPTSPLGR